jgi:hypothetical protein
VSVSPTTATQPEIETVHLSQRIAALRKDISSAREKERRLRMSIHLRLQTLNRLQTQLAMCGESGAARSDDGQ